MEEFVARCVMGMHTRDDGGASPQPHSAFLRKQSYLSSVCITRCAAEGQHCARQVLGYLPRCGCAVPRGTKSIAKLSALNWGPRRVARAVQRGVRHAHDPLPHLHACRTARPPPFPSFGRQQFDSALAPSLSFSSSVNNSEIHTYRSVWRTSQPLSHGCTVFAIAPRARIPMIHENSLRISELKALEDAIAFVRDLFGDGAPGSFSRQLFAPTSTAADDFMPPLSPLLGVHRLN